MSTIERATARAATLAAAIILTAGLGAAANAAGLPGETLSQSYRESQSDNVEYQKVEPFQMFDNLYYIGPGYVGVYLITTSEGLILIDTAQEPYVDWIIDNIRKVGFDPADIEYILISHGHLDHFGGAAKIQEISGARVGAMIEDWEMIEAVGARPARDGGPSPRVPERDIIYNDGDTLTLGDTTLQIYQTAGHTPGVLSTQFTVYDNGTPHQAFFAGGTGGRGGLEGFELAAAASARTVQLENIEIFLPNHAWNAGNPYPDGSVFERALLLAERGPGDPNPFVDGEAWTTWITIAHQRNVARVEEARREAGQ